MLIYITGLPGVGKSTLVHELRRRGLEAYSSDEDGFNAYYERATGRKHIVKPGENHHTPEWDKTYIWKTNREMLIALKQQSLNKTIYIAGITANHDEIWDLFDVVFYLFVDEINLRGRLENRTTNSYGGAPHELEGILKDHKTDIETYTLLGATIIDASQPVEKVVDDILTSSQTSPTAI